MPNKMLVDATHPEETRVVVLRGNRVEEFDYESANRKQLRGNIYLAKVTRVEPSLQAAFIEYGGNRHGFLAFSEIHPDYYQIPTADRQALLDEEARAHADEEAEHERRSSRRRGRHRDRGARRKDEAVRSEPVTGEDTAAGETARAEHFAETGEGAAQAEPFVNETAPAEAAQESQHESHQDGHQDHHHDDHPHHEHGHDHTHDHAHDHGHGEHPAEGESHEHHAGEQPAGDEAVTGADARAPEHDGEHAEGERAEEEHVEVVGGADAMEEAARPRPRHRRQYKIQEVIKRRQVMLVQVVKEERGSKGAALTTYLSLAGRYSVLMPNTARGGGISRKITNAEDRRRMKEMVEDLQVPDGMGIILRTAGQSRNKTEIKRDFEYLLRVWEQVRDLTLKSTAPTLVYEEGSLTKRSIRDLYNKDIDEIVVSGETGYSEAKEFMRMLMPSHAKNVKQYRDAQPIFTRYGIESQLDAMFSPTVQLKSGGYIVINQTEALVAIDVNSGRATREHHIEDTATKTNMEAADEVARQLRLRDLAGLIVIDFIDMDESRNNRTVERRLKEALKHDRARIQVGRISHFGLMEMSRQRIRTSVLESSTEKCPYCGGSGHVRSVSSVCLQLLRALEEQLLKGATHNLVVRTRSEVALYILNHKRAHLRALEDRFKIAIVINSDPNFAGQMSYEITRGDQVHTPDAAKAIAAAAEQPLPPIEDEADLADQAYPDEPEHEEPAQGEAESFAGEGAADDEAAEDDGEGGQQDGEARDNSRRKRRRRGRRGRGRGREASLQSGDGDTQAQAPAGDDDNFGNVTQPSESGDFEASDYAPNEIPSEGGQPGGSDGDGGPRRRRRGRRGGRRNRERREAMAQRDGGNNGRGDFAPEQDRGFEAGDNGGHGQSPATTPAPEFHAEPPARPAPPQVQDAPPAPETPQRRRSTVREAAPGANWSSSPAAPNAPSASPSAPSEPGATDTGDDASPPKRGWWGRRLLGD